jgi:transposase
MQKSSTVQARGIKVFKARQLTIGLDLGDRWSFYCVLDESGKTILEQKLSTTPEAMRQTFAKIPQSYRNGGRNAFPLGEPAIRSVGS